MKPSLNEQIRLEKAEHTLFGGILYGVEGRQIELQARFFGAPKPPSNWDVRITGMANVAVREVQGRIAGAFAKLGMRPPCGHILINLAPAGLPKYGTTLDLPIAIICLQAAGYVPDLPRKLERSHFFLGELSLHGELRRVNGALPITLCANPGSTVVVPNGNQNECRLVRDMPGHEKTRIAVADDLEEVIRFFQGKGKLRNAIAQKPSFRGVVDPAPDFSVVKGQEVAKRAMVIAAAGGHNVLMVGPPGEGKSLLANALRGILPPLSSVEKIELTRIYSAKGLLNEDGMVVTQRPFRAVHHTTSRQALVGGGSGIPEPGEITLSHRGILFLDEFAEFSRATLETLRQPIEGRNITISRVDASLTFPAEFTLVAAMNPCPCGFLGQFLCQNCLAINYDTKTGCSQCGKFDFRQRCECKVNQIQNYRKKISGPILDRVDLTVEVRALSFDEKFSDTVRQSTQILRNMVSAARERQRKRFAANGVSWNAAIPAGEIRKWCEFDSSGFERYKRLISEGAFSMRATDRMAKLARTIADLEGDTKIKGEHIAEAAAFIGGGGILS